MSLSLKEIPGLSELLEATREVEVATREDAWLGITQSIAGQPVRLMTVRDYTALLQFQSPLLNRSLPNPSELAFFLWVLSPEMERWHEEVKWRGQWLRFIEQWQSKRHGKMVRKVLRLAEIEAQEDAWHKKASVPFVLPDNAPLTVAIKQCFEYVDMVFMDRPAGLKKDGDKAGLCYLTSWFDVMQSEYHLPSDEIWKMPLPLLFARIKAIQIRRNANLPEFNMDRDKIFQGIMQALRAKVYTEEDLRAGRVDLKNNRLN